MAEPLRFSVDAFLEGGRLQRGVDLEVGEDRLTYGEQALPFSDVFWTSRRAGLLFVFSRDFTAAFNASDDRLEELARVLDGRLNGGALRRRLLEPLADEVVICSAGAAVSGSVEGEATSGLHVTVFTQRALHLFAREKHLCVEWPVDALREAADSGRGTRTVLELRKGDTSLRILYLFPEEIGAVREVAEKAHAPPAPTREEAIEMFARREVAGPTPARLPEFATSTETIRERAERAAAGLPSELRIRALLEPHFLEGHFQELGEIALGPLLFRKSAASRARSLAKAVEAMDAGQLQDDARAASLNSLRRLTDTYERELTRLTLGKRRVQKLQAELCISPAEQESLQGRFLAPVHKMAPQLQRLERAQAGLLLRLERLEAGPPEGEEAELDEAAEEWHAALVVVDRSFDGAWQELLLEVGQTWSETLLPRLVRAASAPRQRVPEWVKLLIIGIITTLIVASVALVALR